MAAEKSAGRERAFAFVLIALSLAAFFVLNVLTPVQRDDWSYAFDFVTKGRISSFGDIFRSLGIHYVRVNGRLPVHFLAHLFQWIGKTAFDFINTAAFAGLITLIYFHAFGTLRGFRPYAWLAAFVGVWALTPAFGESLLWVTGASNYLYGILMVLLYLIPFRRCLEDERPRNKPWYALPALLLGVVAGWTNENTGGALAVLILCLAIWRLVGKKRVPFWWWAGLAGVAAGVAIMVLAPGELSRLSGAGGTGGLYAILPRAARITLDLVRFFWPGIAVWVLLLVVFIAKKRDGRLLRFPVVMLIAGCAASYSMALSPQMPSRVWCGPLIFFIISALALWRAAGEPSLPKAPLRVLAAALCAALVMAHFAFVVPKLVSTKTAFDARAADAAERLARGERDLTLDPVSGSGSRFDAAEPWNDISVDPDNWLNVALARYYGADSVAAKER